MQRMPQDNPPEETKLSEESDSEEPDILDLFHHWLEQGIKLYQELEECMAKER